MTLVCAFMQQAVANPVIRQQAQQNAQSFLQQRGKSIALTSLRQAPMSTVQADMHPAYYIFNIGNGDGYVIASGDDCVPAVLGYSETGSVGVNSIPCNMQWWLDEYASQVRLMRKNGLSASLHPSKLSSLPVIAPLLTCRWSQGIPYNRYCPIRPNGSLCATGCVATAMAQTMYYFRDRTVDRTTDEIPAYVSSSGISVDAIPAGSFIDWGNMIDEYNGLDEPTEEQKDAVARLMQYCGAAVHMNYSTGSSSARLSNVLPALMAYFNYTSRAEYLTRNDFSDDEWESLVYAELSNLRPVLYSGVANSSVGHAFVIDGYDGEGYYHINWGWGDHGGYYLLTPVESGDRSVGGYDGGQNAIFRAEPRPNLPLPGVGMHFADPIVRAMCLQYCDVNDDGALTLEEAMAITELGSFMYAPISSFDEFQYFTGVKSLRSHMFTGCEYLESIILHDSVETIGQGAFENCSSLKIFTVPVSVTSVGTYPFSGCSNMTELIWNAKNCSATIQPIIPNSVERLTIGDSVQNIPNNFAKNANIKYLHLGKSVKKINSYAFYKCAKLERLVIPDAVTEIHQWAFFEDTLLRDVTFGASLINIGDRAFDMCRGLKTVSIPNSVTRIGMYAFYGCTRLKSVKIGNSVTTIGGSAFSGCESLKMLTCLMQQPPSINTNVFNNLYEKVTLRVPARALEAYKEATTWKKFAVIIPIDPSLGDVNLDGKTDIADVTDLINQILKADTNEYGDVDGDGTVGIADVSALINKLLAGKNL